MQKSYSLATFSFLIVILVAVGQMSQTMYVPSIGYMASEFKVSPASLQAVMAVYLIPYGLSQFFYGPISDRIGRRVVILSGLTLYIAGTILALFAHDYSLFLAGCFVQGLGIGAAGVMCRTLPRDCFSGDELHRTNSIISMCMMFSPLLAPVLGGYLTEAFGWRSSYLFLALFSIAVLIIMTTSMKETLPLEVRRKEPVLKSYRHVLSEHRFQGYLICLVATFAGVAVFEAAAGVLLGGKLKLAATTVSILFILPIPGYLAGAGLSSVIAKRWSEKKSLDVGLVSIVLGAAIVLVPGIMGLTTAPTLIGGAVLYFLGAGILFPAATTGALSPFPQHAGTAGALLGGMQNLGAGLATMVASMIPANSQMPVGLIMFLMALLAVYGLRKVHSIPPSSEMPLAI